MANSDSDNPVSNATGSESRSTATRRPSMFQATMVFPMVDKDYPPYRLPGTGPGESELWRAHAIAPTMFDWPPPPPPPSSAYPDH